MAGLKLMAKAEGLNGLAKAGGLVKFLWDQILASTGHESLSVHCPALVFSQNVTLFLRADIV